MKAHTHDQYTWKQLAYEGKKEKGEREERRKEGKKLP